jgi:hypothetical protein
MGVFVCVENPLQFPLGQVDLDNVMRLETREESVTETEDQCYNFW